MARHTPTDSLLFYGNKSPEGFWPNPNKEMFGKNKTPPWQVPTRRKASGYRKRNYFYDLNEEKIIFTKGGEITTEN